MSKKSYSFEKTDVRGQKIKNITANTKAEAVLISFADCYQPI